MNKQLTQFLDYVGVDDKSIDLFEGQYLVPKGISYNSYILYDEKIAVLDTADKRKTQEWLQNVQGSLNGKTPDYLIISHMEPDHSASVQAFLQKYPSVTVVGNEKTFAIAERFFGNAIQNKLTVKDGDALPLGKHSLQFVFAPMVHWPEVIFSYETTDKILFSADAFGTFGALDCTQDWGLKINTICPLLCPVLSEYLGYYFEKYDAWSSYRAEERGVFIAYASIYGNTAQAAEKLAELLREKGVTVQTCDLARGDASLALANAFRFDSTVLASVTYDGALFPAMDAFLNRLKAKNFQNRRVALVENGSWAPAAARLIRARPREPKGVVFAEHTVTVKSAVSPETVSALAALAEELAK